MLKDKRLERVCADLVESQIKGESVIIRQLSSSRKDEARYGRFLQNEGLSVAALNSHLLSSQDFSVCGIDVLSIQDSSEIGINGGKMLF